MWPPHGCSSMWPHHGCSSMGAAHGHPTTWAAHGFSSAWAMADFVLGQLDIRRGSGCPKRLRFDWNGMRHTIVCNRDYDSDDER
jgi:hypothetical protein